MLELEEHMPKVAMTNIYPYHINTGLFQGFAPLLSFVIPSID